MMNSGVTAAPCRRILRQNETGIRATTSRVAVRCVRRGNRVSASIWLSLVFAFALTSVGSAADVVVVCADGFRDALAPWCEFRRDEGLTLTFCRPSSGASETATRIREAADPATRYVVLVGDAPPFTPQRPGRAGEIQAAGPDRGQPTRIPTFYLPSKATAAFGSTPTYPSDLPYGDFDGDGFSDAAVGRLPVVTSDQLAGLVHRILAYESSRDFGVWRRGFQLTAGVGGFGMLIDGAIESVTRTVLTSVLPAAAKAQIAYASPGHTFCPPGDSFCDAVLSRYQNGSRFWVYAGHGSIDQLNFLTRAPDDAAALAQPSSIPVTSDGKWQVESLLDNDSVDRLAGASDRASIGILLACYSGAYDAPGDCLAERMLLTPGGPVALIAASRLTMPYGNARFGLGLLESAYQESGTADAPERLGDAMLAAVDRLQTPKPGSTTEMMIDGLAGMISPAGVDLADERNEHAGLYHLLGDPTLNLQSPQPLAISIEPATTDSASLTTNADALNASTTPIRVVRLSATSPIVGTLTVCVDRPLTAVSAASVNAAAADHDPHGCTLGEAVTPVQSGVENTLTIPLPPDWSGPVVVRGIVQGIDGWASGAVRTIVSE
ncbi:C25 family cysteine peptidase [Allorhodopirellula solitaria]|uniref:Gingipain domain-containing protein n=1 Tax=Allorhodopirellula solitaria TaxID=2527987 RepID=A0A5C5XR66_9BACT|nr:C25 family cysteine peptidase [Allorhodopirellula solitaria]TWT65001.1 hypothetical protein CA85_33460 [Allorhodopirellula solitaria]